MISPEQSLGRPTNQSMTFNIVPLVNINEIQVVVSGLEGMLVSSVVNNLFANEPVEVDVINLKSDNTYSYVIRYAFSGQNKVSSPHEFRTQRPPGSTFKFSIIADSHLFTEQHCNYRRYKTALENVHED